MRAETTPVHAASTNEAKVVFARHTSFGGAISFVVVDQNKKFVAALRGKEHAIASLPPGEYTFYVITENTDVIRATLEAGRTYVIEARVRMGVWKAQVTAEAVRRVDAKRYAEALAWLRETPAKVPAGSDGQTWVDDKRANIDTRITKTNAKWEKNDPAWQAAHTLAAEDGYLPNEVQ